MTARGVFSCKVRELGSAVLFDGCADRLRVFESDRPAARLKIGRIGRFVKGLETIKGNLLARTLV